ELANAGSTTPASPGRVTLRRLNRDEYNRTIHDLTGVTFNPADDFPSDDVGHGFDNIGDVLSMPPILLEKYLNAAERIVEVIFVERPTFPARKRIPAKELESTVKTEVIPLRFSEGRSLNSSGAIFTKHKAARDGELTYRVRLVAKYNGEEP